MNIRRETSNDLSIQTTLNQVRVPDRDGSLWVYGIDLDAYNRYVSQNR